MPGSNLFFAVSRFGSPLLRPGEPVELRALPGWPGYFEVFRRDGSYVGVGEGGNFEPAAASGAVAELVLSAPGEERLTRVRRRKVRSRRVRPPVQAPFGPRQEILALDLRGRVSAARAG